jgi:hypothetical protein
MPGCGFEEYKKSTPNYESMRATALFGATAEIGIAPTALPHDKLRLSESISEKFGIGERYLGNQVKL